MYTRSIRIAFMGDLALSAMPEMLDIKTGSGNLYDFAVCNLEGSYRTSTPLRKLANIYNSPEAIRTMFDKLGIRYVNLANNHAMDFGEEGLRRLQSILDGIGVRYFGAGRTRLEAIEPVLVSVDGMQLGFIGLSWKPIESVGATCTQAGVALIPSQDTLCDAVADLRRDCDHVVVSFHWGYEYERYPLPVHRKLAHAVVDAGASVVVGHHPHVYQGLESYNGGIVYYSLGNFYMSCAMRRESSVGLVPVVTFSSNSARQTGILHCVRDQRSNTLSITEGYELTPTIESLSSPLELDDESYERFFRQNRLRRKGLPVFTGSAWDIIRYVWMDFRSWAVRTAVRLGMWS